MKRKLRHIGWMLLIFLLSGPVGYIYLIVHDKILVIEEYVLNYIIGTICCIIVVGGFSFLAYKRIKKKQFSDPPKMALFVYTILLFITPIFQYNSAIVRLNN